jgi:hypothetical protein
MILKEFGPTSITHTVLKRRKLLDLLNMEQEMSNPLLIKLFTQQQRKLDLFWEVWTIIDTLHSMVFSPK